MAEVHQAKCSDWRRTKPAEPFWKARWPPVPDLKGIYSHGPAAAQVGPLPKEASTMPANIHAQELSPGLNRGSAPREEVGLTDRLGDTWPPEAGF